MTLKTEKQYQAAFQRLEYLVDHEPHQLDEIKRLGDVVNTYEKTHGHEPVPADSLIFRLEREMLTRGLNKKQLADLLGITATRLSEVLHGKREVNMDLAKRLYKQLGIPAEYILEHA